MGIFSTFRSRCEQNCRKQFFSNGAAPGGVLEHPGTIKDPERLRTVMVSISGSLQLQVAHLTSSLTVKSNQPPKPFLKPAKSKSRKDIINVMKDTLEKEMENI